MCRGYAGSLSDTGRRKRIIYEERQIDLSGLRRVPQLNTVFDHYQLEWLTRPLSSYNSAMVPEFYESYRATVVLSMCRLPGPIRNMVQPQLDHTLLIGVRINVSADTIYWVIFGPDYITLASIDKCDYKLRFERDQYIIREAEHRR